MRKKFHHLKDDEISVCTLPHFAQRLNKCFGTKIPTKSSCYDIYSEWVDKNHWEFELKLNSAFEMCKYCRESIL